MTTRIKPGANFLYDILNGPAGYFSFLEFAAATLKYFLPSRFSVGIDSGIETRNQFASEESPVLRR